VTRPEEIAARVRAATPGPWRINEHFCVIADGVEAAGEFTVCVVVSRTDGWMPSGQKEADGALIANAPADLSWLLAERDRLRGEVERLTEEKADALSTIDAWFDTRKRIETDLLPDFLGAVAGYLRVCRSGGMPTKLANKVEDVVKGFAERDLSEIVRPHIQAHIDRANAAEAASATAYARGVEDAAQRCEARAAEISVEQRNAYQGGNDRRGECLHTANVEVSEMAARIRALAPGGAT
jgi:hypothetical protein